MIYGIIILAVLLFLVALALNIVSDRTKKLERTLEELENEAKYNTLLPKIHRYGLLTGLSSFYREGQIIVFDGPNHNWDKVKLSKVEEKLAALEKAIEIACKCVKKK